MGNFLHIENLIANLVLAGLKNKKINNRLHILISNRREINRKNIIIKVSNK